MSGASFAVLHIGFSPIGVVLTFGRGLVMAAACVLGERSLTPSLLSHALIIILIEAWLLLFIVTMDSRLASLAAG